MWKMLKYLLKRDKNEYLCTHRQPNEAEYWECTYMTRAGKVYFHWSQDCGISRERVDDLIRRINAKQGL
jgi:hypothetical protein